MILQVPIQRQRGSISMTCQRIEVAPHVSQAAVGSVGSCATCDESGEIEGVRGAGAGQPNGYNDDDDGGGSGEYGVVDLAYEIVG